MTATRVREVDPIDQQQYREALRYLYDRINYERMAGGNGRYRFRLLRMRRLLEQLGLEHYLYRPGRRACLPVVHIAGTKGKGSTATLVAAALSRSGLKTGLYTSPHLAHLEERFRIDGCECSHADLATLVGRLRRELDTLDDAPATAASFFELTTALALMHFDAAQCDAIVLEVGLGGRLDSTNVCASTVTAITSIGLDHQQVLGDTLEQIAAEKAGIIKPHVPVVSGAVQPAATRVIRDTAAANQSELLELGRDFAVDYRPDDRWGSQVEYRRVAGDAPPRPFLLGLEGEHQVRNAGVAIACLEELEQQGVSVHWPGALEAFGNVACPARIEPLAMPNDTVAIVDAAHNEDSIDALCRCIADRRGSREVTVVFGTSRDKPAAAMLSRLSEVADRFILTRYQANPRYRPSESLLTMVPAPLATETSVIDDPVAACTSGLDRAMPGGLLVVCGSFFLVAETRDYLARLACEP